MATIRRLKTGWRAEVARLGVRRSKVLSTKQAARDWAAQVEGEILGGRGRASKVPFGEILDRYAREVSPGKRGHKWEAARLERLQREPIASRRLCDLTAADFAEWRDARLREVAPATVRRELNLISAIMTQARKEWRLIDANPLSDVRKPSEPQKRERRVTSDELARLAQAAGSDLTTATGRVFAAFRFGIETGMRSGEILGLTWGRVSIDDRVARLDATKNGDRREVPLSVEAVEILQALPRRDPIFGLQDRQRDALWRKIRARAMVEDLHFHDSRHEAVTRLSRKLDVLALARMIGHRDLKMLMRYYDESAADIAKRL